MGLLCKPTNMRLLLLLAVFLTLLSLSGGIPVPQRRRRPNRPVAVVGRPGGRPGAVVARPGARPVVVRPGRRPGGRPNNNGQGQAVGSNLGTVANAVGGLFGK